MPNNTVRPDGNKVKRLRLERGWSQEELASRAIISKRTIEHIEANRATFAATLAKLARPLGVEPRDLLARVELGRYDGDQQASPKGIEPTLPSPTIPFQIVIKGCLDDITDEKRTQLFERIKQLLDLCGDLRVINIREGSVVGSVVVTVVLTPGQAVRLRWAVKAGDLADFGVVDARGAETEAQMDVTRWIGDVKAGDPKAAQQIWEHYFPRLLMMARKKIRDTSQDVAVEDVALSALASFSLGHERGQSCHLQPADGAFTRVRDRAELWPLLVTIATWKALEIFREDRRQRARGKEQSTAPAREIEHVLYASSPPDIKVVMKECQHLLADLGDPELRSIAVWNLEGYTNQEIATMLGCTPRTVERKLRLIRSIWSQEEAP
jgi:transcriptional regulator with XRE-family HTH domain/DNA-directed RNA polymerase specialized sigma24 family protein